MSPEAPGADRDHPRQAARRVAKNTIFLAVADISGKLTTFVFFLVAARALGVEKFGVFSFALAFVSMFSVLTDFGLGQLTAREIARDYNVASRYVSNAVAIKLTATAIVLAVVALTINLLGYPKSTVRVVYICSFVIIDSAFTSFYRLVFQGFERTVFVALGRALQIVLMTVGLFVLSRGPVSIECYAWFYIGVALAIAVFVWSLASLFLVKPGLSFDLLEWKRMLKAALPFGLAAVLIMFYYWNGSTLLSKMKGDLAVGFYSAPFRLVLGLTFLSSAFAGATYPVMSRVFVTARQRLPRVVERSLRYMVVLAVPLGVLGVTLARPIILFLYGANFELSVQVLRVLVWWGAFMYLNSLLGHYFLSVNRPRTVMVQAALSLVVNLVLNLVLIPRLGALGAAVSIAAAEVVGFAFLFVNQLRTSGKVRVTVFLNFVARAFAAAVVIAPIAWLAARWHALAGLSIALLGYFGLLLLFRGVGRDDLDMLRLMLRRSDG